MRRTYNANSTKRVLSNVFPSDFKMIKDETSNGFIYMNSLYGVEVDSVRDYLDQAKHYISFENFDYGLDYGYSEVQLPVVILSGQIYGDDNVIKITSNEEFVDGKPTRMVRNYNRTITLSGYVSNTNGNNGLEYMRTDKTGSGLLYINTSTNSSDAIRSGIYQTYTLPLSDVITPVPTGLSGFNSSVLDQTYTAQHSYEVLQPLTYDKLSRAYSLTKYVYLPNSGIATNAASKFLVDFYQPEKYYWDNYKGTYKPVIPTKNSYMKNGKEVFYRVALNNPNGSGVFNTEYLDLEHTPISGTLKLYDLDSVDDNGMAIEIASTGTTLYAYTTPDMTYSYVGYDAEIPYEEGLGSGVLATAYTSTSWDYVYKGDGLTDFVWKSNTSTTITNKIKIVNPTSRYFVEYKYAIDNEQYCITTMNCNRYIKYNAEDYIYSSNDLNSNAVTIDADLSVEKLTRRAVTFNGFDVRPGSIIQSLELNATMKKESSTNTSTSIDISDSIIPGAIRTVLPQIDNYETTYMLTDKNTSTLTPNVGTLRNTFVGNIQGQKITVANSGIHADQFYELYNPNLTENRVVRARFKLNTTAEETFHIVQSLNTSTSWNFSVIDDYKLHIQDDISSFKTIEPVMSPGDIVEVMLICAGAFNNTLRYDRFIVLVKINDSFFKMYEMVEDEYSYFTDTHATGYTEAFNTVNSSANIDVDFDFITIYDEGNLNDRNLL